MLVFDTSAYINGWRIHYRPATFPTVWERIAEAMEDGRIMSPREVYNELQSKDDDVATWAHDRVALFVDASEQVQREVGPIEVSGSANETRRSPSRLDQVEPTTPHIGVTGLKPVGR